MTPRQKREALTAFNALIAAPHDLGASDLIMPAGARLALSHSAGLVRGEVTVVTVAGRRSWSHPALGADAPFKGDWADEGSRVSLSGVPVGTATLYLVNPLDGGKLVPVATLVVV